MDIRFLLFELQYDEVVRLTRIRLANTYIERMVNF